MADFGSARLTRFPWENANVAQLVEQLIRNQQVAGSNPAVGSSPTNLTQGTYTSSAWRLENGSDRSLPLIAIIPLAIFRSRAGADVASPSAQLLP
jgi:hypothetical protein